MKQQNPAARTFPFLLVTLTVYFLLWQLMSLYFELPPYYYARLIEFLSILLFAALACFTPMRFDRMGILTDRRTLARSLALGGALALGAVCLLAALSFLRGNKPLICSPYNGDISRVTYVLVAPLQEVLSKSVMYYSVELCFEERHPHLTNALCALLFAIFHVVYGLQMMLLSMALSLITGWIFQKFRCVWGCAVVHFSLGFFPACFGF